MSKLQKIAFRDRGVVNAKRMGFSIRIGESIVEFNHGVAMVSEEIAQYVRKNMEAHFIILSDDGSPKELPPVVKQQYVPPVKEEAPLPSEPKVEPVSDDDLDGIAVGEMVEDLEEAAPKTRLRVKPRPVTVKEKSRKKKGK